MPTQQKNLFDTEPAEWELDDQNRLRIAKVVLPTGPAGEFDYLVPAQFADLSKKVILAEPGRRLLVPLGRSDRQVVAYCVDVGIGSPGGRRLKQLMGVIDQVPLLSPHLLELGRWISDYYLAPLGQVLEGILPAGVRGQAGTRETTLLSVPTHVAAQLAQLKLSAKQREILTLLAASSKPLTVKQLAHRAECTAGPIMALRKKGYIAERVERIDVDAMADDVVPRREQHILNAEQIAALKSIERALDSQQQQTLLLRGVTGSGKTEVYIQAIEKVVSFGRQAIVLVPEISLTPQTVGRFRERFDHVAVLHSHQSDVERHRHWRRIASGEVQVVVGARSAIFAPTPHLGLVVIDEEHEGSFKQDSVPRYHARDVALRRTEIEGIPLVLGSATPSLESWHRARQKEYQLVELASRVSDLPLPIVRAIDLREERVRREGRGVVSRPLHQAMSTALAGGGQIILLLNRRGFSTNVQCPACGFLLKCHQCDVPMVYHRQAQLVLCHWCDHQTPPPTVCPDCQSAEIRYSGSGTQKLEAEVRARFPEVTVLRMDTDSMRRPGSHAVALDAFRKGEVQILLGTQMIAKGLDFPNVTLVGVVNADTALHWPDFRAAERTFQLVTQVAGRTGRGTQGGQVLVQTLSPDHPAIAMAMEHDYVRFATHELLERRAHELPPYESLARVIVRGPVEATTLAWAEGVADQLKRAAEAAAQGEEPTVKIIGPAPCPLPRLRDLYRMHFLVKAPDHATLHALLAPVLRKLEVPEEVEWQVDVDAVDMM